MVDARFYASAAIIVEPIAANMGFVMPQEGYLKGLQRAVYADQ